MRASRFSSLAAALLLPATLTAGVLAAPAHAAAVTQCNGSFCVKADRAFYDSSNPTIGTGVAAAAADLQVSVTNSSTNLSANKPLWLQKMAVDFGTADTRGASFTMPSQLPATAVVGGSTSTAATCSGGADGSGFVTSCPAGNGNALADVTGSTGHNGVHGATVGVAEIVNSYHSGGPETFQATLKIHIPNASALGAYDTTTSLTITASHPSACVTRLTMPASVTLDLTTAFPGASADVSLSYLRLRLRGLASENGAGLPISPAAHVITLPTTCGTAAGSVVATDRDGADAVAPYTFNVYGCPYTPAGVRAQPTPLTPGTVAFSAFNPGTPTAGRTAHLVWSLGDGTTTEQSFTHTFATTATRTITVQAVDNAGAMSTPTSLTLQGSKISVAQGNARLISGKLTDDTGTSPVAGEIVSVYQCATAASDLSTCTLATTTATGDDGTFGFIAPVSATPVQLAFEYDGTEATSFYSARFGAVQRLAAKPTPTVALKAAKTSVPHGKAVKLSGSVSPNLAGKQVSLQQYTGSSWKTIATKTLSSTSTYTASVTYKKTGKVKLRTVIAYTDTTLASASKTLTVKIT